MTEETGKIEDMNSLEAVKLIAEDVNTDENFRESITMSSTDTSGEPPLSPSQSVDSNVRTETTESNSMEFSPEDVHLPGNELDNDHREDPTVDDTISRDSESKVPKESSKTINSILARDTSKEAIESTIKQPEDVDHAANEASTSKEDKPVNGLKLKEGKEGEVNPKITNQPSKGKTRSGKMVFCRIHLLDGQLYETDVTKNATGKELFEKVCGYLTIQEKDYFGLQYVNNNVKFWLNNEKKILKQVKGGTCVFDFSVKFYPPEPLSLLEDISRFQLCLQVRFDIFNGKLPCSFTTLAILGSYMVQAEVGDYDNLDEYEFGPGDSYLDKIEYAPDKSPQMRSKVHELHKTHKGLTPEEAELQYLQNAKKLAMYGVDLHQARDSQGVKLMLGVCASGIQVYKDRLRINRFVWPAILKLSYKRNNFYVKKRPQEGEKDGDTVGFKLDNHKMAKRLWKTCVEHHAFFRLHESDPPKSSTFPGFNSRFRYSGRTQKQVRDDVEKVENRPKFDRSNFKYSSMPQANNTDGYTHGYPDEKDRTDQKNAVTTPSTESGPPPYYNQDTEGYNKMETSPDKPNAMGDSSEDRRDRTPGEGEAIEMLGYGADTGSGDAATLEARGKGKKSKEDKEREKREKEEEKRRKKEEEKERKRLEKERKQGKGSSEDRTDKMGGDEATAGYGGHAPGSAGFDSTEVTKIEETKSAEEIDLSYNKLEATDGIPIEIIGQDMKAEIQENVEHVTSSINDSTSPSSTEIKNESITKENPNMEEDSAEVSDNKVLSKQGTEVTDSTKDKTVEAINMSPVEERKELNVESKTNEVSNSVNLEDNIEDEVFVDTEQKQEVAEKAVCNHVGSETGSFSSDSSDDEDVCGSYHVESPMEDIPQKTTIKTIVEEQSVSVESVKEEQTKTIEETVKEEAGQIIEIVNDTVSEEQKVSNEPSATVIDDNTETIIEKVDDRKSESEESKEDMETKASDRKGDENLISTECKDTANVIDKVTEVNKNETGENMTCNIQNSGKVTDIGNKESGEMDVNSGENPHHERKMDEKRDFDIVVSEQKSVSPDGSQVISLRSERRTETIQKEVVTHTRRELKPEEFAKYEKEIEAADRRNRIENEAQNQEENQLRSGDKKSEEIAEIKNEDELKIEDEKTEDSIVEVKIVKSDNSLEENVEKMKYIDESSGDSGSVKIKTTEESLEVVTKVGNVEAEKNEVEVSKLDKKESLRLKKEEKERKRKEKAEEKQRKIREKKEEKERIKKEKQEEKERKKKEKEAEREKKRKEKENKKSKKIKVEEKLHTGIEVSEQQTEKKDEQKSENLEETMEATNDVEERVPTAIAMVIAKQKEEEKQTEVEEEKMEEINLNDDIIVEETHKEELKNEKKRKKSKKDKKEKQNSPKNKKKHKTTGCFAFSAVPSSDEEEVKEEVEPIEVKEEIVQEEVKHVEEEVKVVPKQKGKGLGWALPGMDELQQKGTKHEDENMQPTDTSISSTSALDGDAKAPLAELTEMQDQLETDKEPKSENTIVVHGQIEPSPGEIEQVSGPEEITREETEVVEKKIDIDDIQESSSKDEICESELKVKEDISVDRLAEQTHITETDLMKKAETIETEASVSEVGFGADGEMINRVLPEGEGSIDRRMQFIPVTPPIQETKDSLKNTGDTRMPFFDPASEDSTSSKKVPPPVPPKGMRNGFLEEDQLLQDMPPTIPTESFTYENNADDTPISTKNVPYVKTKTQTVTYEKDGYPYETEDGILISSQSHSTRTQTIETTTYKTEKDGKVETRVEKKVVITDEGDDDDLDHDDLLAEAIRSVTEMNPDLSVERIECMRQIEEVEK